MTEKKELCLEMEPLLDSFYDRELDLGELTAVESHLAECARCQSKLSGIERVARSVAALPRLEMERDIDIDGLLAESTVKHKGNIRLMWAAAAAAAVFLIVVFKVGFEPGAPVIAIDQKESAGKLQAPGEDDAPKTVIAHDVEAAPESKNDSVGAGQIGKKATPAVKTVDTPAEITTKSAPGNQVVEVWDDKDRLDDRQVEVAFLSDDIDDGFADAVGLDTDEDGLYVLRM